MNWEAVVGITLNYWHLKTSCDPEISLERFPARVRQRHPHCRTLLIDAEPFGTDEDRDVSILFFVEDVTLSRRMELISRVEMHYAEAIVETIREPLVVLDPTLRVKSANDSFYRTSRSLNPKLSGDSFMT